MKALSGFQIRFHLGEPSSIADRPTVAQIPIISKSARHAIEMWNLLRVISSRLMKSFASFPRKGTRSGGQAKAYPT